MMRKIRSDSEEDKGAKRVTDIGSKATVRDHERSSGKKNGSDEDRGNGLLLLPLSFS